jgi:hypothetical protein
MRREVLGGLRIAFALLALAAMTAQLVHGLDHPRFSVANFFSYFTIESNLIAAGVLIASGAAALRGLTGTPGLDTWRGAATLYMTTTGLGYSLLLAGDNDALLVWADVVVHYVMPVVLVADWLLDRPAEPIPLDRALAWMAFPTAFFAYTLVRGEIADWYPYPFLDVADRGYPAVLLTGAIVGLLMIGFSWLLLRVSRRGDSAAVPAG